MFFGEAVSQTARGLLRRAKNALLATTPSKLIIAWIGSVKKQETTPCLFGQSSGGRNTTGASSLIFWRGAKIPETNSVTPISPTLTG